MNGHVGHDLAELALLILAAAAAAAVLAWLIQLARAPGPARSSSGLARGVAVLGFAAGVLVMLSPVHVHDLGVDVGCGLGPLAAAQQPSSGSDPITSVVAAQCRHEGDQRLLYGGIVVAAALLSAAALRRRATG